MLLLPAPSSLDEEDQCLSCLSTDGEKKKYVEYVPHSFSELFSDEDNYTVVADNSFWENLSTIPKPSEAAVLAFCSQSRWFSSSAAGAYTDNPRGLDECNWLSPAHIYLQWDKLSRRQQLTFRRLVYSDIEGNSNKRGTKSRDLAAHLMMTFGSEQSNFLNTKHDPVLSNIKEFPRDTNARGNYYSGRCDNRTLDPKSCYLAFRRLEKNYNMPKAFNGHVAYSGVVVSDDSYSRIVDGDFHTYHKKVSAFFRSTAKKLGKLQEKGFVVSYIYSNEISVDSILGQVYRPHVHFTFWIKKDKFVEIEQAAVDRLVHNFNNYFKTRGGDRTLSMLRTDRNNPDADYHRVTSYSQLRTYVEYMHRSYSLHERYAAEITPENVRELNKATVETYRNLDELFRGQEGGRAVLHFSHSCTLPKREKKATTLPKDTESNTIKENNPEAMPNKPIEIHKIPQRPAMAPNAAQLSTPATPPQPYAGQRATEADLASFPISVPDWMQGGGRLMFQDPPKPAPQQPVAPVQPPTMFKGGSILADFLSKQANRPGLAPLRTPNFPSRTPTAAPSQPAPQQLTAEQSTARNFSNDFHDFNLGHLPAAEMHKRWGNTEYGRRVLPGVMAAHAATPPRPGMGDIDTQTPAKTYQAIAASRSQAQPSAVEQYAQRPAAPAPQPVANPNWQQQVMNAYPEIGKLDSAQNKAFRSAYQANPNQDGLALANKLFGVPTLPAGTAEAFSQPSSLSLSQAVQPPLAKAGEESSMWEGLLSKLAEEGASEDFLMGFMKGAEELSSDRHRIVPQVPNYAPGMAAGAVLGQLVGSEFGLGNTGRSIATALGAGAGGLLLPHLVNKLKDPYGVGANAPDADFAALNRASIGA